MRFFCKLLAAFLLFLGIGKFCDHYTAGLRIYELESSMPSKPLWETAPLSLQDEQKIQKILNQPFFFLEGGGQSYAFLSQDGQTVLKFFRHDHPYSPKRLLEYVRFPFGWDNVRIKLLNHKSRRDISPLLNSSKLAYDELKEETGLLYIHLNKTKAKFKKVVVVDRIGVRHSIDLDATEFILQKKVNLLFPSIQALMHEQNEAEARALIESLILCLEHSCQKGIGNTDGALKRNFGCVEGRTLCLDFGSFIRDPSLQDPQKAQEEIIKKTARLARWLKKYYPSLHSFYESRIGAKHIALAEKSIYTYASLHENVSETSCGHARSRTPGLWRGENLSIF